MNFRISIVLIQRHLDRKYIFLTPSTAGGCCTLMRLCGPSGSVPSGDRNVTRGRKKSLHGHGGRMLPALLSLCCDTCCSFRFPHLICFVSVSSSVASSMDFSKADALSGEGRSFECSI